MGDHDDIDRKVEAIAKLLKLFKFERIVYLTVTIISLIALLICATYVIVNNPGEIPLIAALFGSTGGIAFSCGRLLKMWGDAMQILSPLVKKEN